MRSDDLKEIDRLRTLFKLLILLSICGGFTSFIASANAGDFCCLEFLQFVLVFVALTLSADRFRLRRCGYILICGSGVNFSFAAMGLYNSMQVHGFFVNVAVLSIIGFASLLLGLRYLRLARSLERTRHGRCRGCGYDLRQSAAICSECGRPVDTNIIQRRAADRIMEKWSGES